LSDLAEKIKSQLNIVDFIGKYVELKKRGTEYIGLCPFHNEKTPSFSVNEDKQVFYCYGCHQGGDLISFYSYINKITESEAIAELAQDLGIVFDKENEKKYFEVTKDFHNLFQKNLKESPQIQEYLHQRGFTDDTIKKFKLGWGGETLPDTDLEIAKELQYMYEETSPLFNRVIIPIYNNRGQIVGFSGRLLGDGQPKYKNTSNNKIFKKSSLLFGWPPEKGKDVFVVEGYMDVIKLFQLGCSAVAIMGTSLSDQQAKVLKRASGKVHLMLDNDNAGAMATIKAIPTLINSEIDFDVVQYEGGDPGDLDNTNFTFIQPKQYLFATAKNGNEYGRFIAHIENSFVKQEYEQYYILRNGGSLSVQVQHRDKETYVREEFEKQLLAGMFQDSDIKELLLKSDIIKIYKRFLILDTSELAQEDKTLWAELLTKKIDIQKTKKYLEAYNGKNTKRRVSMEERGTV